MMLIAEFPVEYQSKESSFILAGGGRRSVKLRFLVKDKASVYREFESRAVVPFREVI